MMRNLLNISVFGLILTITTLLSGTAHAQITSNLNDIFNNVVNTTQDLPGLLSALAYGLGLLLGVLGVLKLKEHVENPNQIALRVPVIRFLVGGGLFALPIIYESMEALINAGTANVFNHQVFNFTGVLGTITNILTNPIGAICGLFGVTCPGFSLPTINGILSTIIESISLFPGLVSAVSYMLGLLAGIAGLLKLKDHVEEPNQTPLKEGVTRFIFGGALFALPSVYSAMREMFGDITVFGTLNNANSVLSWMSSPYDRGLGNNICVPGINSLGDVLCMTIVNMASFPLFLSVISYAFGIVLGVWALFKIRDHVLNPNQTSIWEGLSMLFAGGAFFSLPLVVEMLRGTMMPFTAAAMNIGAATGLFASGYNETATACGGTFVGLDQMIFCTMNDLLTPANAIVSFFTFVAGTIFIMIGISRLMKSAQEGPRGPGGIGTIMTFVTGALLISSNEFMRTITMTFFGNPLTLTNAALQYTGGMTGPELAYIHTTISALVKFMIIVGVISFARGIFILREVAEGNGQASMMSAITHMVAGALAVNIGPFLNVIQRTLGIQDVGITFG